VRFAKETLIEPYVKLGIRSIPAEEVFGNIASVSSRLKFPDVADHPEGILIEVDGPTLKIFAAKRQPVGRVFDLSVVAAYWDGELPLHRHNVSALERAYGGPLPALRATLAEAGWDDPAFDQTTLPDSLRQKVWEQLKALDPGAPLSQVPEVGDYFDQMTVQRGAELEGSFPPLSRANWTVLELSSDRLSSLNENGRPIAPPVFIRGKVEGKLVIAYSLPDELCEGRSGMDLKTMCDVVVLSDRGGVPGGLSLADDRMQTDPGATGTFSEDYCLVMSRGVVATAGPLVDMLGWVADPIDPEIRINLLHQALLAATTAEERKRIESFPHLPVSVEGVLAAGSMTYDPTLSYSADMRSIESVGGFESRSPEIMSRINNPSAQGIHWSDATSTVPPPLAPSNSVNLPVTFRYMHHQRGTHWSNTGALGAFEGEGGASAVGNLTYDYRWRKLSAQTLQKNMGVPVQPILIYRKSEQ
jgi:hypothetical protein